MSRVATPFKAPPAVPAVQVPREKIAMRAYDKWCQRGQPQGTDVQDWLDAERELRVELSRTDKAPPRR